MQTTAPPDVLALVRERRTAAGIAHESPLWGLALSGGGIRSATFALGLVRALAQRGLLHRFDLMSTVSGGGYAGSAIGKLFHDAGAAPAAGHGGARQVETQLAQSNSSWMVWWLRATSRYLAPRGGKDLLQAAALALRNVIAIHLELALVFVLLGGLLALVHVGLWRVLDLRLPIAQPYPRAAVLLLQPWMSLYWLLLLVPVAAAAPSVAAYWSVPSAGVRRTGEWRLVLVFTALAAVLYAGLRSFDLWCSSGSLCSQLEPIAWSVWTVLVLIVLAPLVAKACFLFQDRKLRRSAKTEPDTAAVLSAVRSSLTWWLTGCLRVAILLFFLGVIDRVAWALAMDRTSLSPWVTPAVMAVVLAMVRFMAARLTGQTSAPALPRGMLMQVVSAAGLLLLALLGAWWVSLVYRFGLGPIFPGPAMDEAAIRAGTLDFDQSTLVLAGCLAIPAAYMLLTMRNWDFLNTSSLHMFYRGRLVRSYLGAVNRARFLDVDPLAPVDPGQVVPVARHSTVFDVVPGDGVGLATYAPHRSGGPVHLVNVTLNQSYDARGGLYNQDRKGQSLCITTTGLHRLGLAPWAAGSPEMRDSELASWMAISGAAFTPGLGGQTSPGVAALLFMAGVRLGYWWPNPSTTAGFFGRARKYGLLTDELVGNFGGDGAPCWYLSDGGHFENTGAYSLLAEQAKMIVVSDAGADPAYGFEDLENLVRKARIDLGAEIEFLKPVPGGQVPSVFLERFGSITDLRDPLGQACLALARVHYRRGNPATPHGWLVLVKPNIYDGLPVDLVNYKASCASFPQETTTDQFFSEKQWESYYVLGERLGGELRADLLEGLANDDPAWVGCFQPDTAALDQVRAARGAPAAGSNEPKRLPRFGAAAASGAGITLLVGALYAGWQGWDTFQTSEARRHADLEQALSQAAGRYEQLLAGEARVLPDLKASLADIAQRECARSPSTLAGSPYARMFADVEGRCLPDRPSPSCDILHETVPVRTSNCFVADYVDPGAPHYWGRPYHRPELVARAPARVEAVVAQAAAPAPVAVAAVEAPRATAAAAPPRVMIEGRSTARMLEILGRAPAAEAPAAAGAAAPAAVSQPSAKACQGKTVYIQRYGPKLLDGDSVDAWRATNVAALAGAKVPQVEDVWASAQRRGRPLPRPLTTNVAIYHTPDDMPCAQSLAGVEAKPLAVTLHGTPGVVEVWIAPPQPVKQ